MFRAHGCYEWTSYSSIFPPKATEELLSSFRTSISDLSVHLQISPTNDVVSKKVNINIKLVDVIDHV